MFIAIGVSVGSVWLTASLAKALELSQPRYNVDTHYVIKEI